MPENNQETYLLTYNSIGDDLELPWNQQSEPGIRPMKLILSSSKSPQLMLYHYRENGLGEWERTSRNFQITDEEAEILLNKHNHYSKIESTIWPYLDKIYKLSKLKTPSYFFPVNTDLEVNHRVH